MPSTLAQTLTREIQRRGGVTRSLGPLLVATYGKSDLTRELTRRAQHCQAAGDLLQAQHLLSIDLSVDGALCSKVTARIEALLEADAIDFVNQARAYRSDPQSEHKLLFQAPRSTIAAPTRSDLRIGRNDPCPCGSGLKFKRCHLTREEELPGFDHDDVEGLPGLNKAEAFVFRRERDALALLAQRRLEESGPRLGETLFWPIDEAPDDELELRARLAIPASPRQFAKILNIGVAREVFDDPLLTRLCRAACPMESWRERFPVSLYRHFEASLAHRVKVAGQFSARDVIGLADEPEMREAVVHRAIDGHQADYLTTQADSARAFAQAGVLHFAHLLPRMAIAQSEELDKERVATLKAIDGLIAPMFGISPITSRNTQQPNEQVILINSLRARLSQLEREQRQQRAALAAERTLRERAETAWSDKLLTQTSDSALKQELRDLRERFKQEHTQRRQAERRLTVMQERERARLLRRAQESDGDHKPLSDPKEKLPSAAKTIKYSATFEQAAQRVAPSTRARLRTQLTELASGQWVREVKRMAGSDGIWTLRAGLNHRVLFRDHGDHLEVFNLVDREELETTLAKLRQQ